MVKLLILRTTQWKILLVSIFNGETSQLEMRQSNVSMWPKVLLNWSSLSLFLKVKY